VKAHPAAELFPMLSENELVALKNDILAHQQEYPIIVWNDMIVDGRNRFRACEMLGRKPKIKEMQFADEAAVISYIISTNMRRRHLTESQRAMIASELANLPAHRPADGSAPIGALTQDAAAEQMQVSRRSVQRAAEVQEKAPDLAGKVKSGELKVSKAAQIARERSRPSPAVTDYANADDSVIDKKEEANATGYTPKMEKVWSAYSALDAVEQTAFRERLENLK
jgi:ParB-like chromosome segregation protein Spo0J